MRVSLTLSLTNNSNLDGGAEEVVNNITGGDTSSENYVSETDRILAEQRAATEAQLVADRAAGTVANADGNYAFTNEDHRNQNDAITGFNEAYRLGEYGATDSQEALGQLSYNLGNSLGVSDFSNQGNLNLEGFNENLASWRAMSPEERAGQAARDGLNASARGNLGFADQRYNAEQVAKDDAAAKALNPRALPSTFNYEYYLKNNPDVATSGKYGNTEDGAKRHWRDYGYKEGRGYRDPNAVAPGASQRDATLAAYNNAISAQQAANQQVVQNTVDNNNTVDNTVDNTVNNTILLIILLIILVKLQLIRLLLTITLVVGNFRGCR